MDGIIIQILNGLDKGSAYALIALGLTLIFGTLGVVNFAHGALFLIGAFVAVFVSDVLGNIGPGDIINFSSVVIDETQLSPWGTPVETETPYTHAWFGENVGMILSDWSVPISILVAIPIMLLVGFAMERGLIKHFYHRPHSDQILVTFGLAIVIGEIIKAFYGANPIQTPAPEALQTRVDLGVWLGFEEGQVGYPAWRIVYFFFSATIIAAVFAFLQFTTFGMVVRAGMADRETVGLLGIDIDKRFTFMFGLAAAVAGLAGVMYAPIISPHYNIGMDFLVLTFVVVVVGGMGSLPGAVLAGFLLGMLQSFASWTVIKNNIIDFLGVADTFTGALITGLDQVIIYLVAIIVLLTRPRGLLGRKGVMED